MQAAVFEIQDRARQGMSQIASPQDFSRIAVETTPAHRILESPAVSLYCLDDESRQAVFVELPDGIDLSQAPFYYQTQFENALRLIVVPYHELHELAGAVSGAPDRLILIHNIGRCGSTLLHHALNQVNGVVSLSEPDVFGGIVTIRQGNASRDAELARSCMRIVFRSWPQHTTGAVKFRLQGVQIIDLMVAAFPQARHVFMYRNAVDWAASIYRLVTRHQPAPDLSRAEAVSRLQFYMALNASEAEAALDLQHEPVTLVEFLAIEWCLMLERYLFCHRMGLPLLALRYEDLIANSQPVLEALMDYCDLPRSGAAAAFQAFAQDSQRGTRLARDHESARNARSLSTAHLEQIHAVLQKHPLLKTPDPILPGTLQV